jgi:glycosyltransferase involved in cell wall biosynthesis
MKIGIYLAQISAELGGGARFQKQVVDGLLDSPHDSHEFFLIGHEADTTFGRPQIVVDESASPTRARRLLHRAGLLGTATDQIAPTLQQHHIDLIYSPHPCALTTALPYVVTCWDLQHRMQPFFPEVSTVGWTWESREQHYSNVLRRAAAIVTGTEQGKREVTQFYGVAHDRVTVIPFTAPDVLMSSDSEPVPGLTGEDFIVYPAQFWPHKNHITILHALKHLQQKANLRIPAVFPGSSQPENACTMDHVRDTANRLDIPVHFPGFVSDGQLRWLYENSKALVFASLFGPDNLPPLEAMSLGCPVVASKVRGSEEQFGAAALLVDPGNEIEMAEAIESIWNSEETREKLIERGSRLTSTLTQTGYTNALMRLFDRFARVRRCWP